MPSFFSTIHLRSLALSPVPETIPPLQRGQLTYYSPVDIKRWGVQHFLDVVAHTESLPIPNLGFTAEENTRMDELLCEERAAAARGL